MKKWRLFRIFRRGENLLSTVSHLLMKDNYRNSKNRLNQFEKEALLELEKDLDAALERYLDKLR